jgi:hypothetical protein
MSAAPADSTFAARCRPNGNSAFPFKRQLTTSFTLCFVAKEEAKTRIRYSLRLFDRAERRLASRALCHLPVEMEFVSPFTFSSKARCSSGVTMGTRAWTVPMTFRASRRRAGWRAGPAARAIRARIQCIFEVGWAVLSGNRNRKKGPVRAILSLTSVTLPAPLPSALSGQLCLATV